MSLAAIVSLSLSFAAGPAFGAASYYQEGLKLLKAERYQEAVVAFEKEAAENPGSAEVLMNLGWLYWKVNRIDDAWRCFDLLAKLDPKNASYLRLLAEAEVGRKEYPHALDHAQEALRLLPGDKDASIVMSSALIGLKRHDDADKILRDLVERYPDSPAVQFRMADNLAAMGRLEESLTHFDLLLRLSPDERDYRRARANVLYAMGRTDAAVAEWKALAALTPPDQKAIINLGYAAWKDRDFELAFKYGDWLVQLDDKNPAYLRFLANIELERENPAQALRLAQRALDVLGGDKDASLLKAKSLFVLYRDKEAMAVLTELLREYPDNQQILFNMADFLAGMHRDEEALVFYGRLIKAYPDNLAYRYRKADLHYDIGDFDKAVSEWKRITEKYPAEVRGLQSLQSDAMSRDAWDEALLYSQEIAARRPLTSEEWMRVASIYFQLQSYPQSIAAADKAAAIDGSNQAALFLKAETMERMSDLDGAESVYHKLLQRNPNSARALISLARIAEQKGDNQRAIRLTQTLRRLAFSDSSSSPYLDILEARLWADSGKLEKGMRVLKKKALKKRMSLPVLVYHGVTKYKRGSVEAIPRVTFEEQMEAVKKAGFTPIKVEQLERFWEGKGSMPDKPILITFDDARADAFNNADPVLKRLDFEATMFVHMSAKAKRSRYYSSGAQLRTWNETGRWEVQAHSEKAHQSILIDRAGHKGHFLSNLMWLPEKKRLETPEEFQARLDGDFKHSKEKMQAMFPKTRFHSYAFPFGDMGQTDFTNFPEAPAMNWQSVHRYYKFAFTQDINGFNRIPSKGTDLTRKTVLREMTARDLMRHLTMEEPWIKAKMLEASLWVRTNQPGRALSIYRLLRTKYGIDEAAIYGAEALAFDMFGNGHVARRKWREAVERDPSKDKYRELAGFSKKRDTPRLSTEAEQFSDDFSDNTRLGVRYSQPILAARVEPFVGRSFYGRDGLPDLAANEAGLGLRWFLTPRVRLDAEGTTRRFLDGAREDSNTGHAQLTVPFFAPFRLGVRAGLEDVPTRQAIGQGIFYRQYGGLAEWDVMLNTSLQVNYDQDLYSDGNAQRLGSAILSRKFGSYFKAGYAFRYSESDRRAVDYYSPRRAATNTGMLTVNGPFGSVDTKRNVHVGNGSLTVSAGYGSQDGVKRVVEGVRGSLTYRLIGDLSVSGSAAYTKSPAYISRTLGLSLGLDF